MCMQKQVCVQRSGKLKFFWPLEYARARAVRVLSALACFMSKDRKEQSYWRILLAFHRECRDPARRTTEWSLSIRQRRRVIPPTTSISHRGSPNGTRAVPLYPVGRLAGVGVGSTIDIVVSVEVDVGVEAAGGRGTCTF